MAGYSSIHQSIFRYPTCSFSIPSHSMYPSSSSSSSSQSMAQAQTGTGLTRYGSAPGSLLTSTVDAVIGGSRPSPSPTPSPYYSGDSSESTCKEQRSSYPFGSALLRQKSSPAGFLSATTTHNPNGPGFTITRGGHSHSHSRLNSQLSFTPHSQDSQNTNNVNVMVADPTATTTTSTSTCFPIDAWDNSIAFSPPPTKRSKNTNDPDILHSLNAFDSHFTLPHTSLEIDNLLHIPQDSVPCKIRAKRGCATHPRSIAERERRTRISGKLKKLQDLVPNMDKQTSYADMLDLAVQHIKGLQTQVQKLHKELESCSCGCKQSK